MITKALTDEQEPSILDYDDKDSVKSNSLHLQSFDKSFTRLHSMTNTQMIK